MCVFYDIGSYLDPLTLAKKLMGFVQKFILIIQSRICFLLYVSSLESGYLKVKFLNFDHFVFRFPKIRDSIIKNTSIDT